MVDYSHENGFPDGEIASSKIGVSDAATRHIRVKSLINSTLASFCSVHAAIGGGGSSGGQKFSNYTCLLVAYYGVTDDHN